MMRFLAALLSGVAGAMGLGGGSVLLIYLTLMEALPQSVAQGINLIFFLPCAAVALIFHIRAGLLRTKILLPILLGLLGAAAGVGLSGLIAETLLRKIFAALVLGLGIQALFAKAPAEKGK